MTSAREPTVGVSYQGTGLQLTAGGGTGPYSWTVTGTLPQVFSLSASGVLSGIPETIGSFPITVNVKDATTPTPKTASRPLTLVLDPALEFSGPPVLPFGTENVPYNETIYATGGMTPYTFKAASALPPGLTLTGAGVLSGTPTATGTFTLTVEVTDATTPTPNTAQQGFSLTVVPQPLVITTTSLPGATQNVSYQNAAPELHATGGTPPYSWTETGALPNGVTLGADGYLSGTPTVTGTFVITAQVSDATKPTPLTASKMLTLVVNPPLAFTTTSPLPGGTVNMPYVQAILAQGGVVPYTFTETGTLPPGLTLGLNGVISGTPTTSGTFSFTVSVIDATVPIPRRRDHLVNDTRRGADCAHGQSRHRACTGIGVRTKPTDVHHCSGTNPAPQTISLTSTGGTANGLASYYGGSWLTVDLGAGATPTMLTANVGDVSHLAAGSYSTTATVQSSTPGVVPVVLTVNLTITP